MVNKNDAVHRQTIKPTKVRLEAATICQLHCPSCYMGMGKESGRGKGYLSIENFKKFIDANPHVSQIELAGHGEIFLNPDLLKILKYAYEKRVKLTANTGANMNYISDEVCEALVKYKLRSLVCAIDGASQETYKIYRVGGDFDKVIENIKKIIFYKKKYKSKFPLLHWQFVIFGHNERDLPLAKKMAKELNMSFVAKLSWDENYSPIKDKDFVKKETGLGSVTRSEYYKEKKVPYMSSLCSQLWIDPQINWDGRVFGCCLPIQGDYGNAFEVPLKDILSGEKMSYARDMLIGKKAPRKDIPCSECGIYIKMGTNKKWLTRMAIWKTEWRRKIQSFFFEHMPTFIINKVINWLGSKRSSF